MLVCTRYLGTNVAAPHWCRASSLPDDNTRTKAGPQTILGCAPPKYRVHPPPGTTSRVEQELDAQRYTCGKPDEIRTHKAGECELHTEERGVLEDMRLNRQM